METDLKNQLNIQDFNGQLMGGSVALKGFVNWHEHVSWDIKGRLDRLNPKDKTVPKIAQDFLPPNLDANLSSSGSMEKGLALNAQLAFDQYETESHKLIELGLPLPAYEKVMKASHAFNMLDARHAISVTERQR